MCIDVFNSLRYERNIPNILPSNEKNEKSEMIFCNPEMNFKTVHKIGPVLHTITYNEMKKHFQCSHILHVCMSMFAKRYICTTGKQILEKISFESQVIQSHVVLLCRWSAVWSDVFIWVIKDFQTQFVLNELWNLETFKWGDVWRARGGITTRSRLNVYRYLPHRETLCGKETKCYKEQFQINWYSINSIWRRSLSILERKK